MNIRIFFAYLFLAVTIFCQTDYQWRHLNGPLGGIIGDIAIDSKDNIYAGAYTNFLYYYSGIYKSTDNGETWRELNTGIEDVQTYSIFIDENDKIYLGTSGRGLHLSEDYGESWTRIDTGYNTREWFVIGRCGNGTMIAGDAQYQEMYKSYNDGYNWEFIGNYAPLNIDIDQNNNMYVSTLDSYLLSTDNGETWNKNEYFTGTAVSDILILDNGEMLLGTGYGNFRGSGIYKSVDDGETWELKGLNNTNNILSLNNDKPGIIYAGAGYDGLYQSTDRGESWTRVNGWGNTQVFRIKLNSKNDIFIGSEDEGVYRSTDDGESFKQVGLPISNIRSLDISRDENYIYTATPSGVQVYDRLKEEWRYSGLYGVQAVSISPSGKIYAATKIDGVYFSDDEGNTWQQLPFEGVTYNIKSVNDTTLLLAGSRQLFLSRDRGETWNETGIITGSSYNAIYYNEVINTIIISGGSIYLSDDFASSFDEIETDYSPYESNSIFIDNNGVLYIASNLLNNNEAGVYKSEPPYTEWVKLFDGLSYTINVTDDDIIYAGTYMGVIQSINGGENWQLIFNEQTVKTFPTVLTTYDSGKLLIGTYGYGLYELQLPTSVTQPEKLSNTFYLSQNYPNPFNPETVISFQLAVASHTKIIVYDVLGKEVTTLVNKQMQPGKYEVKFDGSNLSSGIYFYRLKSGGFVQTGKMMLMK